MSIEHLKKQAKNLVRLLPSYIKKHPDGGSLAACQELIAKASGFPSFHAAAKQTEVGSEALPTRLVSSLILQDLVSLQAMAENDSVSWLTRVRLMVATVYKLQLDIELQGKKPSVESMYSIEWLEELSLSTSLDASTTQSIGRYLECVPGYRKPSDRENAPIHEAAKRQHGLAIEAIPRIRKLKEEVRSNPFGLPHLLRSDEVSHH